MNSMIHRTTFALDRETVNRMKRLAALWQVSQAEVVRRAVAGAAAAVKSVRPDPAEALRRLHESGGGLSAEAAERYLAEVREDRRAWRRS